jgi:hypothetical protein
MRVTYAQFNVEHKGKFFKVQMTPQDITANEERISMTVVDSNNKTLLVRSMKGRQIICKFTAKMVIKELTKKPA